MVHPSARLACSLILAATALALAGPLDAPAPPPRAESELDSMLLAFEAGARETPRDTFDLHAVLAQVGREPEKLFAFVRDCTSWVPYAGALRGAKGVLMDRVGNDLDRALCLAGLFRACGHEARLAQGTQSEEQARAALVRIRAQPASRPAEDAVSAAAREGVLAAQAKRLGLEPADLMARADEFRRGRLRIVEDVLQRTEEQSAQVL